MTSKSADLPLQRAKPSTESLLENVYELNTSYVYLLMPCLLVVFYPINFYLQLPWAVLFLAYGVIPKLDSILKMDWKNPTLEEMAVLEHNQRFRFMLYLTLVIDWLFLWRGLNAVYYNELSIWALLPFVFMMQNASATGFLVAHELFHKPNTVDRVMGKISP